MTTNTTQPVAEDWKVILELEIDAAGAVSRKEVRNGREDTVDDKLIGRLYPGIRVARVTLPEYMSAYEEAEVEKRMKTLVFDGISYKLVGVSGSAKQTRFYFVDAAHQPLIAKRYQRWPEAMVTYFSILTSDCRMILEEPDLRVAVVKDHVLGTNDCRGWLRKSLYRKAGLLPVWFTQFRMAYLEGDKLQFKGAVKPFSDQAADILEVDMILPESACKPELKDPVRLLPKLRTSGRLYSGPAVLGFRQWSESSEFSSSASLVENASLESFETEIKVDGIENIRSIRKAFDEGDYSGLLNLLGRPDSPTIDTSFNPALLEETEKMDIDVWDPVDAVLLADKSGFAIRFPYVLNYLNRKFGRKIYRLLVSAGFSLPSFALVDDGILVEHEGKILSASDWIPRDAALNHLEAEKSLCVRYPVRSDRDLLPVRHLSDAELIPMLTQALGRKELPDSLIHFILTRQLRMEGAYVLHSETAKLNGGDFDFDTICAIPSDKFPKFVEGRFAVGCQDKPEEKKNTTKNKAKKAHAIWWNLEHVAMNARGSGRYSIGSITNLKTSCLAAGKIDEFNELADQLQNALDALKWGVKVDEEVVDRIRAEVSDAPWLQYKNVTRVTDLPDHLDVAGTDKVGRLYNYLRKELGDVFEDKRNIEDFRGLFEGNTYTQSMFEECQLVNSIYGDVVHQILDEAKPFKDELETAQAQWNDMRTSEDRKLRTLAWEARNKAQAAYWKNEEYSKARFQGLHLWLHYWAQGKVENRHGWAQALNTVISNGDGTGAVLFHAFPQEIVDAFAEQTGGESMPVRLPQVVDGFVQFDDQQRAFLVERIENPDGSMGEKRLFLWQYTGPRSLVFEDTRIPQ
ncbi:hypothetical protein [Edaphobacter dinghuensis]|uniref:Uncharacterized protein n=1 Tax=Edaphobacter dinghuensis TaxID=1560005 RepID=A0A917HR96_9BACT|nr:hypothetical protein [Edaphobacter dinghuensis]GGG87188.1 hypothetical protein GCM10011585_34030 [Edaphobacter dinghuensis]